MKALNARGVSPGRRGKAGGARGEGRGARDAGGARDEGRGARDEGRGSRDPKSLHPPPSTVHPSPATLHSVEALSLATSAVLLKAVSDIDVFARSGRDRVEMLSEIIQPLKRSDGGYAKSPSAGGSSTYHNFLVAACKQLLAAPLDELSDLVRIVRGRQRADGGFAELDILRTGATNPTAAAVGLLRMAGGPTPQEAAGIAAFLCAMQNAEGGLKANGRIPLADLLSTFTGLVAMEGLRAARGGTRDSVECGPAALDLNTMRRFVLSLEEPHGGFRGGLWDEQPDVEYTFYGLGTLALLSHFTTSEGQEKA
jgi:geranylgeranyl transferase type-2 subunit beta